MNELMNWLLFGVPFDILPAADTAGAPEGSCYPGEPYDPQDAHDLARFEGESPAAHLFVSSAG